MNAALILTTIGIIWHINLIVMYSLEASQESLKQNEKIPNKEFIFFIKFISLAFLHTCFFFSNCNLEEVKVLLDLE